MEILPFGPDDSDRVAAYVEIVNAVRAADSPWQHPMTLKGADGQFRHGWDGEVETPYVGLVEGETVGVGTVATTEYDNLHLAWLGVQVHPGQRRRGHGTELLEALVAETRARGRTSIGIDGWESEATRGFAARHGLEEKAARSSADRCSPRWTGRCREGLHADAAAAASAYELVPPGGADS